jgi:hypothetical protein
VLEFARPAALEDEERVHGLLLHSAVVRIVSQMPELVLFLCGPRGVVDEPIRLLD